MRATDETVYRCDHCNRAIVSKGSMTLHERMCKLNPNNQHMCFKYCRHLVKENGMDIHGEDNGQIHFHCALNPDVQMYSYKLERYKYNASRLPELTRMPLECDKYHDTIDDLLFS